MLYIFLAVMAVLLVMNVFMLLVLRQMAGATGRQIEKDAGRLFGVYDEMLEEKGRELEALQLQEAELLERIREQELALEPAKALPAPSFNGAPAVPARFQDRCFTEMYGKVKESFSVSGEELAEELKNSRDPESPAQEARRKTLEEMRRLLDFDSLYRIAILPPAQQKQVLSGIFQGEDGAIWQEWQSASGNGGVLGFSDWLDHELVLLDRSVVIKAPAAQLAKGKAGRPDVRWEADPSICEGVRLLYQDRLYDYSV